MSGKGVLEIARKVVVMPLDSVILKKSVKVQDTGEFTYSFIKIDHRNRDEVIDDLESWELLPVLSLGPLNLILDSLINEGGDNEYQ